MSITSNTPKPSPNVFEKITPESFLGPTTVYRGRLARPFIFKSVKLELGAGSVHPLIGNEDENGVLLGFTVSTNDRDLVPLCDIRGIEADAQYYSISEFSPYQNALLGRGMTLGYAQQITPGSGVSLDPIGYPDPLYPYVKRYKFTTTGGVINYEEYKGTENDKFFVIQYTPEYKLEYTSLIFNLVNPTVNSRMFHYIEINRIVFNEQIKEKQRILNKIDYVKRDQEYSDFD